MLARNATPPKFVIVFKTSVRGTIKPFFLCVCVGVCVGVCVFVCLCWCVCVFLSMYVQCAYNEAFAIISYMYFSCACTCARLYKDFFGIFRALCYGELFILLFYYSLYI